MQRSYARLAGLHFHLSLYLSSFPLIFFPCFTSFSSSHFFNIFSISCSSPPFSLHITSNPLFFSFSSFSPSPQSSQSSFQSVVLKFFFALFSIPSCPFWIPSTKHQNSGYNCDTLISMLHSRLSFRSTGSAVYCTLYH